MFAKYASNLLQNIYNECMLRSFACRDDEAAALYRNIASRIGRVIRRIGVESSEGTVFTDND
jgi:hypothetical protein